MSGRTGAPVSRRSFMAGSLVIGFHIPSALAQTVASAIAPEINAWVVVKPDDTVVIRIARSEMGQGTLTGLAQLVAEELECDWARVTTEYPGPAQSLARQRVWGSFSTGGSRGIRDSHQYMREGGARARMLLVQAAADAIVAPLRPDFPEAAITIERLWDYPGLGTPTDAGVVRFVQSLTGANGTIKVAFGTEGGLFDGRLGIPTVICGPGSMAQGHKPDEWVSLEQLARCETMLNALVARLEAGV